MTIVFSRVYNGHLTLVHYEPLLLQSLDSTPLYISPTFPARLRFQNTLLNVTSHWKPKRKTIVLIKSKLLHIVINKNLLLIVLVFFSILYEFTCHWKPRFCLTFRFMMQFHWLKIFSIFIWFSKTWMFVFHVLMMITVLLIPF